MGRLLERSKRYAWLLVLPGVFLLYSNSFRSLEIIEARHSVLGDADAANYVVLIEDFRLGRVYGDPYTHSDDGRSVGDNAQKHKIHHVLYIIVASGMYGMLSWIYGLLGLSPAAAMYSINGIVTCVNLVLIYLLLGHLNPKGNRVAPFLIFYAAALSTWIFGSIPESWPFSGTLILLFLLAFFQGSFPYPVLAVLIGLFMLNNMILAFLLVPLAVRFLRERAGWARVLGRCAAAGALALSTWLLLLTLLSLFDPGFRPDEYARYTLWYKQFTEPDLTILSIYVWKAVLSNLFVNSVVSNQADPFVPMESLLYTFQTSVVGLLAAAGYVLLLALVGYNAAREWMRRRTEVGLLATILNERVTPLLAFCGAMVFMTIFLYYPGGFLYSTTVVPLVALTICRFIDLKNRFQMALFYATLVLVIVNNTMQVLEFRNTLSLMS